MELTKKQKKILNKWIGHAADEALDDRIRQAHRDMFKDNIFKGI